MAGYRRWQLIVDFPTTSPAAVLYQEISVLSHSAHNIAIQRRTLCSRLYLIAGESVVISASSEELLDSFTGALACRLMANRSESAVDLQIFIWSSDELGIDPPIAPLIHPEWTVRGELNGFCDDRYQSAYLGHAHMLISSDVQEGVSHVCITKETRLPSFEIACPLRTSLAWHLRARKKLMIHAGAVADSTGGALLVGASGAGKSTLALKCLEAGMQFLADDLCAIDVANYADSPKKVYNVYSTAKIFSHEIDTIDSSVTGAMAQEEDHRVPQPKTRFLVSAPSASHMPPSAPLKAIIQLRQGSSSTVITAGGRGGALRVLAATTNELIADSGAELVSGLAYVLRTTPVFELSMSTNHVDNVRAVHRAIDGNIC